MSHKYWLPVCSLLLLALLLTGCGGGTTTPNPPNSPSNPAPTVTSITPNSGTSNCGTSVTVAGRGFLSVATVKLGGTSATGVTVVNSTTITAATPAHAAAA